MKIIANVPVEISLGLSVTEASAVITGASISRYTIPLFQKADGTWFCRITVPQPGRYIFRCGPIGKEVIASGYSGANKLFRHGSVTRSDDGTYLEFADGKPFFWLADTWWFAGTKRMSDRVLSLLCADRKKKGFTVVLLVAGIPPEVDSGSPEAANAGGYPFSDTGEIHPAYFDELDKKIATIISYGIVPCIVGSWGHHIELPGEESMMRLWREIIARYAAYPVVFCLTGEVDVFLGKPFQVSPVTTVPYRGIKTVLARHAPRVYESIVRVKRAVYAQNTTAASAAAREKRIGAWTRVAEYATALDPFGRLWTVHPHSRDTAFRIMHSPEWLSIDAIQSSHTAANKAWMTEIILKSDVSKRPIINLEPWYEGILGNFDASWQRYAFWMCFLAGAKGHTYGAHGLWQMAGKDNFMEHWGPSDWKRAKDYPGSTQLGAGKKIIERFPWWRLVPAPGTVVPHWSPRSPDNPMAGRIGNDFLIVYVPRPGSLTITKGSLAAGPYTVLWIDPATGNDILSVPIRSLDAIPVPDEVISDAVLIVYRHEKHIQLRVTGEISKTSYDP